ncbi:hypothetical protein KGM_204903A, partial [Danaus plexippus plexippus]
MISSHLLGLSGVL